MEAESTLFVTDVDFLQAGGEHNELSVRPSSPAPSLAGSIESQIFFQGPGAVGDVHDVELAYRAPVAPGDGELANAGAFEAGNHAIPNGKGPDSDPGEESDNDPVDSVMGDDGFPGPGDPDLEDGDVLQPRHPGFVGPGYPHSPDWHTHTVKAYSNHFYYEVGYNRNDIPAARAPREVHLHDERCRLMVKFFDECTVAETVDVHFPNGASLRDWEDFWEAQRARWDEETLVHIHFNGRTWGKNETYTWKVPGLGNVSAYDFMNELNETDTDIVYLLDCWINTRFACFRRKHAMTEFVLAGQPEPVPRTGEIRAVYDGDFSLSFPRILRCFLAQRPRNPGFIQRVLQDYLRDPALAFQLEELLPLLSTPQLTSRDSTLSNNALRIWDLKPSTASAEKNIEIWRIVCDPYICQSTGLLYFCRKRIQPKPGPPRNRTPEPADEEMEDVAPWEGQDEDHDEGFVSDEEEEVGLVRRRDYTDDESDDESDESDEGDAADDEVGVENGSGTGSEPTDQIDIEMADGENF
ncbi:hypothetical protein BST61_g6287 [Cercospora zeina]